MIKKVRATLLVEVIAEFKDNYDGANDEETVRYIVEQDLEDNGFDVRKCEVLTGDFGLMVEQLREELKYQTALTEIKETMKNMGLI